MDGGDTHAAGGWKKKEKTKNFHNWKNKRGGKGTAHFSVSGPVICQGHAGRTLETSGKTNRF